MKFLVSVLMLGIVAGIALPRYDQIRHRAVSVQAVADFNALRGAALDYLLAHGEWPPDAGPGEVPADLEAFLPRDFSFTRDHYELSWWNWSLPHGLPRHPGVGSLIAISLTVEEPEVGRAVARRVGSGSPGYSLAHRHLFFVEGL